MRWAAFVLLASLAGCQTFDPKHPLVGKPEVFDGGTAFYVWTSPGDGAWHVRLASSDGKHRFQGSVAGVHGGVLDLALANPALKDAVALQGDAIQFDVESASSDAGDGFDMRIVGGCARFDLYIDGKHHPEHVRLGPRAQHPAHVPFDRCP
jgi:hypothetical protein